MTYRIEVLDKPGLFDAVGEGVARDIADLGIEGVSGVRYTQIYLIEGNISRAEAVRICRELLADPVSQDYLLYDAASFTQAGQGSGAVVEVSYNPGVMDPVEESVKKGIRDLGISGVSSVKTARKYGISGNISSGQVDSIAEKLLYNKLIQHVVRPDARSSHPPTEYNFKLSHIDLLGASDAELRRISSQGQLFLNLDEMRAIKAYFSALGRNPTDCELETVAQTWSEHCAHKTFRGRIQYSESLPRAYSGRIGKRMIKNLLKSTIMKVTRELRKPWCVSVFEDNSGIIKFEGKNNICFKVETHNHPSALEPFGGANTGIGGVIRDCLGTGLGARPVFNTDIFCFGPPDYPFDKLPSGTLHPKRVMKGVVSGVRDYGNKMGIPTVNGAVLFDEGFICNPLVYCGTAGMIPQDKCFKKVKKGDLIVVAGGSTGRDGIHGATFSSGELTEESETISSGAVQIGNPIEEKKLADTLMQARDRGLYRSVTDCGAGGLSSAVGEMGSELGARVDLDKVPLKYSGLSYSEIWISESQERMVLAADKKKAPELIALFASENVEAAVIGEFTGSGRLELYYRGQLTADLDMKFMHDGRPDIEKKAVFKLPAHKETGNTCPGDQGPALKKMLSAYDVCSKEWIIRQYDHEVQGGSAGKPLAGTACDGPADAAVVRPLMSSRKAAIVSNGINFRFGRIDPYWMAASCIDEALRQVVACGGSVERTALLDNFCWGNPDKPDRLGGLVRASYGCYYAAKAYGVPFISGKDSLYNEYMCDGKSRAIPGTLLISAISVLDDVSKTISMYAKEAGDLIYIVGLTRDEMGGSLYYSHLGLTGSGVPKIYPAQSMKIFAALSRLTAAGAIRSMHDCSEGGLGVAAAEMAFAGGLGMEISLEDVPYKSSDKKRRRNDFILFSESNSRFVVEVSPSKRKVFEKGLKGLPAAFIGRLEEHGQFIARGIDGKVCLRENIAELKETWQKPLRW